MRLAFTYFHKFDDDDVFHAIKIFIIQIMDSVPIEKNSFS